MTEAVQMHTQKILEALYIVRYASEKDRAWAICELKKVTLNAIKQLGKPHLSLIMNREYLRRGSEKKALRLPNLAVVKRSVGGACHTLPCKKKTF